MTDDPPVRDKSKRSRNTRYTETELLETLLANTTDFVYFKDRERRFVPVSRCPRDLVERLQRAGDHPTLRRQRYSGFLKKPYMLATLKSKIRQALEG